MPPTTPPSTCTNPSNVHRKPLPSGHPVSERLTQKLNPSVLLRFTPSDAALSFTLHSNRNFVHYGPVYFDIRAPSSSRTTSDTDTEAAFNGNISHAAKAIPLSLSNPTTHSKTPTYTSRFNTPTSHTSTNSPCPPQTNDPYNLTHAIEAVLLHGIPNRHDYHTAILAAWLWSDVEVARMRKEAKRGTLYVPQVYVKRC